MKTKTSSWTFGILLICILLGALGGVTATALTTDYLIGYSVEIGKTTETKRLMQEQPRAVPKNYEDALKALTAHALPVVGNIYPSEVSSSGYSFSDSISPLVMLTSDGWMISNKAMIGARVVVQGSECVADKIKTDNLMGLTFVHCETDNRSVADLGNGYDLAAGDQVFVVYGDRNFFLTEVSEVSWGTETLRSSDVPARRIHLAQTTDSHLGAAVFTLSGVFVGIVDPKGDSNEVIPFEHVSKLFEQVLKGEDRFLRPSLGVNTIDITRTVGLDETLTDSIRSGALLFGSRAVVWGSTAQDAGLLANDIIISFDGQTIDDSRTLDDLVALSDPGDQVLVVVSRNGERVELSVSLGSLK